MEIAEIKRLMKEKKGLEIARLGSIVCPFPGIFAGLTIQIMVLEKRIERAISELSEQEKEVYLVSIKDDGNEK